MVATPSQLSDIFRRIANLEQAITSIHVIGVVDPEFEQETVNIGGTIIDRTVEPPTGVTATPGAFLDDIYIDVTWTNPEHENTVAVDVELAEKNGAVYNLLRVERVPGNSQRFSRLRPNKNYAVRVNGVNRLGIKTETGTWIDVATGQDTTVPPAVTGAFLARGATSVVVRFDRITSAPDIDVYEVEVDTASTFNTVNYRRSRSPATVVAFNDVAAQGSWYARISAFDDSGNQGPPVVVGPVTAGGIVDSMILAGLDAAKITVGYLDGDRIAANSASIGILETSSLVSADITLAGGSFRSGNPPTTGLLINSQGMRLYAAGVEKMILDAPTGNATFKGHIDGASAYAVAMEASVITGGTYQTAATGQRLVIGQGVLDRIRFLIDSSEVATLGYWTATSPWGGTVNSFRLRTNNGLNVETLGGGAGAVYAGLGQFTTLFASGNIDANGHGDFADYVEGSQVRGQSFYNTWAGANAIDSANTFVGSGGVSSVGNGSFTRVYANEYRDSSSNVLVNAFSQWVGDIETSYDIGVSGMAYLTGGLTLSSGLVTRGAEDSGGAGFRLLRVPN